MSTNSVWHVFEQITRQPHPHPPGKDIWESWLPDETTLGCPRKWVVRVWPSFPQCALRKWEILVEAYYVWNLNENPDHWHRIPIFAAPILIINKRLISMLDCPSPYLWSLSFVVFVSLCKSCYVSNDFNIECHPEVPEGWANEVLTYPVKSKSCKQCFCEATIARQIYSSGQL